MMEDTMLSKKSKSYCVFMVNYLFVIGNSQVPCSEYMVDTRVC